MAACPECGRPVAVSGASCFYCGGTLGEVRDADTTQPREPAPEEEQRSLVVLDLEDVDALRLSDAFQLPAAETAQWVRRGGFRLTTATASPSEATLEVERLAGLGLRAVALDGVLLARARTPLEAQSARFAEGRLHLRHEAGSLALGAEDVVLLVKGPIRREYQASTERRRFRLATLEQGYLFHLHLVQEIRPVELDPHAIEFDEGTAPGSSQLRVSGWTRQLGQDWAVDDGFRLFPPALGLEKPSSGLLQVAAAVRGAKDGGSQVLDNVGQFRFFSAWRGLVERERRNT